MNLRSLGGALAIVIALGCAQWANAAAISGSMSEPFNYPDATNFPNASTLNGGQGFNLTGTTAPNDAISNWGSNLNSGTVRNATAPGLTATATGYLAASGNKLTLDATTTPSHNIGRILGGQLIDSGTTYFSVQMSRNNDTIRTMNLAFFNGTLPSPGAGGSERFAVGMIGATAGNSAGNITLLMNNSNPGGLITPSATPIAMGTGVAHLIVGRIDWNAGGFETVSIWVDPADVTTEAAAGTVYASTSGFELIGFNAIRPFAGNPATVGGNPVPGISANFDEIRLGGTWASVTSERVVPEPSTAALVALGGLALAGLRRRR